MNSRKKAPLMTLSTLLFLTGCLGGSGSSSKNTSGGNVISGVSATGAPISNGKVEVKGSNGLVGQTTTSADGSYRVDVSSLSGPYLVRVIAPSGEKYISVAADNDIATGKKINVTPLSHIIVANVFNKSDADDLFANFTSDSQNFTESKLASEKQLLLQKFVDAGLIGSGKIANANVDLLNGDLKAGTSLGVDGLLDVIKVNTNALAGIEVSLKGGGAPIFVDKVNAADSAVTPVSAGELNGAKAQLAILSIIRDRMNALATLHSSKVSCNGTPVDSSDDSLACDIDNIYSAFLPFFHPNYQEDGMGRESGLWSWICKDDDQELSSKGDCLANGRFQFENVSLKDVTLISYDEAAKVALVNFNLYKDGKLKGSEEMFLKLDGNDNLYKLLGNKKTFGYYIESESLFETRVDKSITSPTYKGADDYSVNLNFYYKNPGSYSFDGDEIFTLTSESSHRIFPGNATQMQIYLVKGPRYEMNGTCSSGLMFSTTQTPYMIFNHATGVTTSGDFATACAFTNDPCNCRPNADDMAYFDNEVAQKIRLNNDQMASMEKVEKINLTGSGVSADSFVIKKPLLINQFNASTYMPNFGLSPLGFCALTSANTTLPLSVKTGSLNHVSVHFGFTSEDMMSWSSKSDSVNFQDDTLAQYSYTPNISAPGNASIIRDAHLYLSSRDEHERRFIRTVNCQGM